MTIVRLTLTSGSPCCWVPATVPALFMSSLHSDRDGWRKRLTGTHGTGHPILSTINILLCRGQPSVSIHIGHQYLRVFHPFREIHPPISSPDIVNNFPAIFLPSPWPSQTIGGNPWISIDSYLWPFLFPSRMSNHWEDFFSPLFFRDAAAVHLWAVPDYHAELSINQNFFIFFGQLVLGNSLLGHWYRFGERR